MLSGKWMQRGAVALSLLAVLGVVSCKKKGSKKKAKANKELTEEQKKLNKDEPIYGEPSLAGNTAIFRGTDKIFYMKATPYRASVNTDIIFEGQCGVDNRGTLIWDMGDSSRQRQGSSFTYAYHVPGKYVVSGTCHEGERNQAGSINLEIVASNGSERPGQNPNQN